MSGITVGRENSTPIDSKDWGTGQPIAHDRRGHGRSTGGGEVARYIGRHGTKRVAKAVLISAVPPLMLELIKNARLEVYEGAPHGLCSTHKDRANADLLAFIRA